jgi:hypothetical protein
MLNVSDFLGILGLHISKYVALLLLTRDSAFEDHELFTGVEIG